MTSSLKDAVEAAKLMITVKRTFVDLADIEGLGDEMKVDQDRRDIAMLEPLITHATRQPSFADQVKLMDAGCEKMIGVMQRNSETLEVLKGVRDALAILQGKCLGAYMRTADADFPSIGEKIEQQLSALNSIIEGGGGRYGLLSSYNASI